VSDAPADHAADHAADRPETANIPYPRLLYRDDGLLALVAGESQEKLLGGTWIPLRLPYPLTPPAASYSPGRSHLALLAMSQREPLFMRLMSQYDVTLDATIWRIDVWSRG
jgi:hypothetical protein